MSSPADLTGLNKLHLGDFVTRFQRDAIPHNEIFSYFAAAIPFGPEELREFVEEPVAALPPAVLKLLGRITLIFVPFLERPKGRPAKRAANGKRHGGKPDPFEPRDCLVGMDPPATADRLTIVQLPAERNAPLVMAFGVQDLESSDYHYSFFHAVSALVFDRDSQQTFPGYRALLREELKSRVHGEVDEPSWKLKLEMLKRESGLRGDSKAFQEYARQSFVDTMTLYLHGICCDIDVEPGPRQIASRHLRKRLQFMQSHFPQPSGYAVFPEELKN